MISIGFQFRNAARLFGFALLLTFVTTFAILFAGMAGYTVLTGVAPAESTIWKDARCVIGLPARDGSACWNQSQRH